MDKGRMEKRVGSTVGGWLWRGRLRSERIMIVVVVLAWLGLVGCGEEADDERDSPAPLLGTVLARSEAAGRGECPHGGSVVIAGVDRDRDQRLDSSEEQTRTVLCDPAPAEPIPDVVLRLVAEPAGANCAEGGTAVQSGRDANGNGRLDDAEVVHIDYVCDAPLVTRMAPEAAGASCVAGGIAFHLGRDRDGDGALADGEIEWTEYECSDVLTRDVMIRSAADAATLAAIRMIDGDVEVYHYAGAELSLPLLQHLNGSLTVHFSSADALESLQLPALTEIDGDFVVEYNLELSVLAAPKLREVGGDLVLSHNFSLPRLDGMTALHRVGGDLIVYDNAALAQVELLANVEDLPFAKVEGTLEVKDNDSLTQLSIGAGELHGVDLYDNGALATLTIEATRLGRFSILAHPQLRSLKLHVPYIESVSISSLPTLRTLEVRATTIGDFSLSAWQEDQMRTLVMNQFYASSPDPVRVLGSLTILATIDTFASDKQVEALGTCTIGATKLTSLHAIKRVEGQLLLTTNPLLTSSSSPLPAAGGVEIYRNPELRSLAFLQPAPVQTGNVAIVENAQLTDLGAVATGVLYVGGTYRIERNPMLTTLPALAVNTVDAWMWIKGNANLTSVRFPALSRVSSGMEIAGNAALGSVQFPALRRASSVEVMQNQSLQELLLPVLTQTDAVGVYFNPSFPSCSLDETCARLAEGICDVSFNDEAATCPP